MSGVEPTPPSAIAVALAQAGPRLRRLRTQRRLTLGQVSASTGISTSTLSRLENGGRRPTLELLLELSHAYGVPLDYLVAAPEEGDPRIHLRAGQVKGRTVIPLTQQPGAAQAWKIIIQTRPVPPTLRSHDGHGWIYVLSGRVRLILAGVEWTLRPGDVASFDTAAEHWFGNGGDGPAEIISIYGRPGEQMLSRTPSAAGA